MKQEKRYMYAKAIFSEMLELYFDISLAFLWSLMISQTSPSGDMC